MNTIFILYDIDHKYYKLSDLRFIFMIIKSKYYHKLIIVYELDDYYIKRILSVLDEYDRQLFDELRDTTK